MEVGIILCEMPTTVSPRRHLRDLLVQVEAAQRNGFTYVTVGQHFLYRDFRWLQPVPTLARLSAEIDAGSRIVTSVLIVPLHHPVVLAEELATLDIVSDGRLVIGVGVGYREEEYRYLGVDFSERFARFEEALELMVRLWSEDRVTHAGKFWALENAPTHVRPAQTPHPPLWLGALTDPGVRRAARLGHAWIIPPVMRMEEVDRRIALFQQTRTALGLPPIERFPLRRDVAVGRDREDALRRYVESARDRYVAHPYLARALREGTQAGSSSDLNERSAAHIADHVVAGSAATCVEELSAIATSLPVGPLIVRPHWPGMAAEDVVAYLDELGREIVPALQELP